MSTTLQNLGLAVDLERKRRDYWYEGKVSFAIRGGFVERSTASTDGPRGYRALTRR